MDAEFRELLLKERAEAARRIYLELTDAEREMLAHIPADQLDQIIRNTKVDPANRRVFLGTAGALMVAAVAIGLRSCASDVFEIANAIFPSAATAGCRVP